MHTCMCCRKSNFKFNLVSPPLCLLDFKYFIYTSDTFKAAQINLMKKPQMNNKPWELLPISAVPNNFAQRFNILQLNISVVQSATLLFWFPFTPLINLLSNCCRQLFFAKAFIYPLYLLNTRWQTKHKVSIVRDVTDKEKEFNRVNNDKKLAHKCKWPIFVVVLSFSSFCWPLWMLNPHVRYGQVRGSKSEKNTNHSSWKNIKIPLLN